MSLSQIITVNITRNTSAAERANFGIPLFVTATVPAGFTERAREYTSLEGLTDDGFATTDNAYLAAQSFFAQDPNVSKIIIGRKDVGDADWVAALTAIGAENDDWYFVTTETRTKADVLAIAAYVEALNKVYAVATAEAASIDTAYVAGSATDTAGSLADGNYTRTFHYWHHEAATKFHECAYVGYNAPFVAGSVTWANLQLNGVPAAQNTDGNRLTDTQITNLKNRKSSYTITIAGLTITLGGTMASGEFIDIIRGKDSLEEEMGKTLLDLLVNQQGGKLPYTDAGLNAVRGKMISVLEQFVDSDYIQPNYKITIPRAKDIAVADKTNRVLNNVSFEAFLVGAIHTVSLSGNLSFEGV